jgi:CDP-diacylglycerol--glycerol-3-phosphate 3-phosphatidyltransferase
MSHNQAGLNPQGQPSPLNLPNAITVARIALVPLFVWLTLNFPLGELTGWWGVLVFVLAISTDGIDGAIARRRGLVTNLGKILDPIADKALTGAGFLLLTWYGLVPFWAVVLILVRELGITAYRLVVVRKRVLAANRGGKLKTTLQAIVIPLLLSPLANNFAWIGVVGQALFWVAAGLTIYTGAEYIWAEVLASVRGRGIDSGADADAADDDEISGGSFGIADEDLAKTLVELCEQQGVRIAVAESLTGGMIASAIVDVPGASKVLLGGEVVYTNEAKVELLGVSPELLAEHGAVSFETADAMLEGIRRKYAAAGVAGESEMLAISATGVAGPGDQDGIPAGTYYVGAMLGEGQIVYGQFADGDRNQVRSAAVLSALRVALDLLAE